MTISEIYSKVSAHMVKGMMIHLKLSEYYSFLNLPKYSKFQYHRYLEESESYHKLSEYYMKNHCKLIEESHIDIPSVIPENWYKHTKQDLDANTVKQGVHDGLQMWVDWEKETKLLYENMYSELLDIGEISDTIILRELVSDVTNELALAIEYKMNKELTNYDMVLIIEEQR